MPTELPIACTLSSSELSARLEEISILGLDALVAVERSGRRATLTFSAAPGVAPRLRAVVAAESECCAFFDFDVTEDPLTLRIEAPAGAEPALDELVDAFEREPLASE